MSKEQENKRLTPNRIALRKFRQHGMAIAGLWVLGILYFAMLFADFLSPYGYADAARMKGFHAPTEVRWTDEQGNLAWPYVYNTFKVRDRDFNQFYLEMSPENGEIARKAMGDDFDEAFDTTKYPLKPFPKVRTYHMWGFLPLNRRLFGIETDRLDSNRPMFYLLGSDMVGRDIFSRVLFGSRISLTIGLAGVAITYFFGLFIGGISGYFGGTTDVAIQRLIEMIMMLPGFYLMLALRAALPDDISSAMLFFWIVIILSFIGWAGLARVIRGMTLSIRTNDYITAAQALGVNQVTIIGRHVLPQTFSYAIVAVTLSIPGYMLGESGLSFLGLGIQEPEASWGNMLQPAMDTANLTLYPWILVPGFFIFVAVMAFNFVGDGLRDAFDPKSLIHGDIVEDEGTNEDIGPKENYGDESVAIERQTA